MENVHAQDNACNNGLITKLYMTLKCSEIFFFAVFMSPTIAAAKPASLERLSEMAVAYVSQIGCVDLDTKINLKNVTEFIDEEAQIKNAYIVVEHADVSCADCTGTSSFNFVLLEHAFGRRVIPPRKVRCPKWGDYRTNVKSYR